MVEVVLHHAPQLAEQGREALAREPERGHRPHRHDVGLACEDCRALGLQRALPEELSRLHAHQVAGFVGLVYGDLSALE